MPVHRNAAIHPRGSQGRVDQSGPPPPRPESPTRVSNTRPARSVTPYGRSTGMRYPSRVGRIVRVSATSGPMPKPLRRIRAILHGSPALALALVRRPRPQRGHRPRGMSRGPWKRGAATMRSPAAVIRIWPTLTSAASRWAALAGWRLGRAGCWKRRLTIQAPLAVIRSGPPYISRLTVGRRWRVAPRAGRVLEKALAIQAPLAVIRSGPPYILLPPPPHGGPALAGWRLGRAGCWKRHWRFRPRWR